MIVGILQARMTSSRLPGKVLKPIMDRPMLSLQLERLRRCRKIDAIVIATSTDSSDDALAHLAQKEGLQCYRGNLTDVLDRFYQAATKAKASTIVRLTGDCPLADPAHIDSVIDTFIDGNYDFICNYDPPSFPDGLDVSVFKYSALADAWKNAKLPSEREHVTPYITNNRNLYKCGNVSSPVNLSALRWTVDEPDDFELIKIIFGSLYPKKPDFASQDVLELLEKSPQLKTYNTGHMRDEGLAKSLKEDQMFKEQSKKFEKSLAMQEKAKNLIPGMTQLLSKRPDMFSFGVWPGYYSKASGSEVWDLDGNKYVDMSIAGIGANVIGYADPDVDAAVLSAIKSGVSSSLNCPEEVLLAEKLCQLHPWAKRARFTRSGGEAMTLAIRVARAFSGKDKIAFCGYHGWHDWYLAANLGTENALGEHLLPGLSPKGVPMGLKGTALPFRYNQLDELEAIASKEGANLGAIVMEPIRNAEPDVGFLEGVRKIATKLGIPLIFDEISSGFRLLTGGAHLKYKVNPDIAVFSKALGNGYAISAIIGTSETMDVVQESFISSTNWTERVGPTAALATLEKHERLNIGPRLVELGKTVQTGWETAARRAGLGIHVGGMAPLSHFSLDVNNFLSAKAYFVQRMVEKGFLGSNIYYAMFAHTNDQISEYLAACEDIFREISELVSSGKDAMEKLRGKPSTAGFKRLN